MKPQQLTSLKAPCCLSQSSITAAVDSNTRCAQNVGNLFKDGDVLPISCRTGIDVELQMHVENPQDAHRDVHKHQQLERTFHSVLLCVHTPGPLGGLSLRGWPTAPYSGCLVESSVSLIVPTLPPLFAKWNMALCATLPPTPRPQGDFEGELDVGPDKRNI